MVEGAVIQEADARALQAGVTTDKLFDMVKKVRATVDIPLVFMTYANPIYTYGTERFVKRCAECGIDGVIVPDVPFEEREELKGVCEAAGVELVSIIAPASKERISMIAKEAKGFLYCVSSLGVTGVRDTVTTNIREMVAQVKEVSDIPCAVGLEIATPKQAKELAAAADGAVAGSAIVKMIAQYGKNCIQPVCRYVKEMKAAVSAA